MRSPATRRLRLRASAKSTVEISPLERAVCKVVGLLLLCVAFAALVALAFETGLGRLSRRDFHPEASELAQYNLRLRSRRFQSAAHCNGFGVTRDRFFAKAGGQWCGQTLWQLPAGTETDSLHSLQLDTKVFATENEARVFIQRFWGYHAREPLHYSLMAEHTASTPSAGDDYHVLMWDPAIAAMQGASPQDLEPLGAAAISKQIVYLYRVGRVMVKVTAAGMPGNLAYALTPQHVADVARLVAGKTVAADVPHLLRTSRGVYLGARAATLGAVGLVATAMGELPQQLSDVALPWLSRLVLPAALGGPSAAEPRAAQEMERVAQFAKVDVPPSLEGSSNATSALRASWDEGEREDGYVVTGDGDLDDDYLFEEGEAADVVIEGEEYEENDVTTTFLLASPTTACARAICSIFGLHTHETCVANAELALQATMAIIVLGLALGAMSGDTASSNPRSGFLVSEATSHVDHSASNMMDAGVRPSLPALSPGLSLSPSSRRSLPVM